MKKLHSSRNYHIQELELELEEVEYFDEHILPKLRKGAVMRRKVSFIERGAMPQVQYHLRTPAIRSGTLNIIWSPQERTQHGYLAHMSVSHKSRFPTWEEIIWLREVFFDPMYMDVAMILPQQRDYVNIHESAFHLWQTPTEWGMQ